MSESVSNNSETLLNTCGIAFFSNVESHLKTTIPLCLKKILMFNDVDSAVVFSKLDEIGIKTIEDFIRKSLHRDMLDENESLADYLGKFTKCQQLFQFSYGQKILLNLIVETCKNLLAENGPTAVNPRENRSQGAPSAEDCESALIAKQKHLKTLFSTLSNWIENNEALVHVIK